MHFIKKTLFAGPRGERLEVFQTLLLWANVAHLDYHQRILVCRSSGEKHIGVKLPRRALDAITEVAQKRRCGRAVEAAGHGTVRGLVLEYW